MNNSQNKAPSLAPQLICRPEQIEGKRLDARSDIFSFGLILYEMLSGKRAFHGSGTADTFAAILRDNPPPIREVVQAAPPELERVVSRCLKKDPDRRFQHIDDVRVALQEVRDELESGVIPQYASCEAETPHATAMALSQRSPCGNCSRRSCGMAFALSAGASQSIHLARTSSDPANV